MVIKCADCGEDAKAPNTVTKYCSSCRIARAAKWHDGRTMKCACGRDFVAWLGAKSARMCGRCFDEQVPGGGRESVHDRCRLCGQVKNLYATHVRVCYQCLDTPAEFEGLKGALVKMHRRLQAKAKSGTMNT